ncbi:flavodoxin [Collinsella sp. UBA1693]|uniref:flavodoxin n=1 Tax=Collinsella sp. UBA1693 TaxID=1946385 RepID=UPI00257B4350|nr:flavodoxin [Collinsella sp. UBA1693]
MNTARALTRRSFLMGVAAIAPLTILLAGCSAEDDATSSGGTASAQNSTPSASSDNASARGNVLVAYYSAQGHTEAVAQTIADELGADTFEITPVEPYSDDDLDWTDDNSRVTLEHEDEGLRDAELTQVAPDGWDGYDTVLVGYPIWWGIAAWPIDNFISGNDWDGKTVIPFCTSTSSGLGKSGDLLAEAAGSGDWREGRRFSSSADESEVRDWVSSLNLA